MEPTAKLNPKRFFHKSYSYFKADKVVLYPIIISVFFMVLSLLVLLFKSGDLPREVPLFYSLPWGEDRLARPLSLAILPASSIFVFSFNFFWAALFYEREAFLARILTWVSTFISFSSFYTLVKIVFLIT